jgi:hypothetical protein
MLLFILFKNVVSIFFNTIGSALLYEDATIYFIRNKAGLDIPYRKNRKTVTLDDLVISLKNTTITDAINEAKDINWTV